MSSFSKTPSPPQLSTLSLHDALPICKLALNGPRTGACETDHLVRIEAPPRVAEEDPEHALLDLGEQRVGQACRSRARVPRGPDRKSTRLNSSHRCISYAVFCLKKKTK